ncbi:LuxR C-terminal-related transcriptional regulator [Aminipila sp.]|uniref:LuxR C-terminal-related transcriptional regulator n=1 Tax=Aminipila sp. TaxID=2060095 RepID=UPI00289709AF|nr:LuxR C-terminal-related transcriptional regulator [Aminipila sp.]
MNGKIEGNESYADFKDLSIAELINGYVIKEETQEYTCIFCGEVFEEGIIYSNHGRMFTAEKAAIEHIKEEHGGSFHALLNLDKQICGLTDIQKNILTNMYEQMDNKMICEKMGISAATVRTHKFNLQKAKREAKILLALIETVEDENLLIRTKPTGDNHIPKEPKELFTGNSLHPFFTQYKYK